MAPLKALTQKPERASTCEPATMFDRHAAPISRRTMLVSGIFTPIALAGCSSLPTPPKRETFVLVHGAWHGGWCWKKLVPLLTDAGHLVVTPTLTGLGERAHLLNGDVDLDVHIADVAAVLHYHDLENVILVGHSYGGMVISGVSEKESARLAQLVYLDAFLPEDGKALSDYAPVPPTRDDGWRVPPPGGATAFGITDAEDIAWVDARLCDQPLRTFTQPVTMPTPRSVPGRFIQCTEAPFFAEAAHRAKSQGFHHHALMSAGHDVMITQPKELAAILLRITRSKTVH